MSRPQTTVGPRTARLISERRAEIDAAEGVSELAALRDMWARVVAIGVARGEQVAPANLDPYVYAESRLTTLVDNLLERDPETAVSGREDER